MITVPRFASAAHRLALCLFCVLLAGRGIAQDGGALQQQWREAYEAKNWKKAIELGQKLVAAGPSNGVNEYNLACVCALDGDKPGALKWIAAAADAGFEDADLCAADPDLASLRKEADFEAALAKIRKRVEADLEQFRKQADEKAIIRKYVPEGIDAAKPAPLIVALHGFGGNAENILNTWKPGAKAIGAILIAPQALRPAGNPDGFEWGNAARAEVLVNRAIEQALKNHRIDEKRIILTGFSQGGLMTYAVGFKHPERFRGLIPVAGVYNEGVLPAEGKAGAHFPRVFIMVGDKDQVFEANRKAAKDLEKLKVRFKLNEYAGVGHAFPKDAPAEIRKALEFVLEE